MPLMQGVRFKHDKWASLHDETYIPSGAARGQTGGGSRAGGARNVWDQYNHLTPEQKRQKAKERRLAKKHGNPSIDGGLFLEKVRTTLDQYDRSFQKLITENNSGHIKIIKGEDELTIEVKDIGPYKFTSDVSKQEFTMQSPMSGLYNYYWDETNNFWKSRVQEHIVDDLLIREFIMHSKGLL